VRAWRTSFDRLARESDIVGYPVLPLVRQLVEMCPTDMGSYIHWGATTQDIMDIASVLQMRSGLGIIRRELGDLVDCLTKLSLKYRDT
jgi:3-carboxy-cis,cis-muconate cycloisomerase